MEISGKTTLNDLLKKYPFLLEFLLNRSPKFSMLKSAVMRNTVGKVAPLSHVAERGGIPVDQLISEIAAEVKGRTGEELTVVSGQTQGCTVLQDDETRQEALKGIIRDLHDGAEPSSLKQRFHELIRDVAPTEIARMEQRLIAEGMPESEIKRLCDVHVQVFRDSLERQEALKVPAGHPLHTYLLENRAAEKISTEITAVLIRANSAGNAATLSQLQQVLTHLIEKLADINLHYLRKENQLFPVLEQHDISGPSEVMWAIHDDIRKKLKQVRTQLSSGTIPPGFPALKGVLQGIADMIFKEEQILFPMALELLTEDDWRKVRQGEEEIGYAWVTPEAEWGNEAVAPAVSKTGEIDLDTGRMSPELLNLMLTHLPVDISFVNEQDEVMYYSQGKERIFPRSPGVIGRKVQKCHPPKSLDTVQKILDEFRAGTRDEAEFWIQMGGRFIHIRYFAVRDGAGSYKGCLEVSQDVSGIRALEGERRLLDWA